MDSSPIISPSSDQKFWSKLRNRVEVILEERKPSKCGLESERGKRLREDSLLLLRGLDSVSSSLSQLSETLTAAQEGANALAKPSVTNELQSERQGSEDEEPKAKRHCNSTGILEKHDAISYNKNEGTESERSVEDKDLAASDGCQDKEDKQIASDVMRSAKLKKAKNLAVSMAAKASSLARELKSIRSELHFVQERCTMLEEENSRLREGFDKGVSEEDDLVRLQLEALLNEKSRLAQENANLTRENQSLHQLVEYHQLTSQDLSASYEQVITGMCLDFSSPLGKIDDIDEEYDNEHSPTTPIDKL
ncbi:uncharacterized protein [Typha latifolia]|uniref:uncharacterized protein n=1 Tax=Typha latifolia TaxID=4733 RepID=UPI003C2FC7CE